MEFKISFWSERNEDVAGSILSPKFSILNKTLQNIYKFSNSVSNRFLACQVCVGVNNIPLIYQTQNLWHLQKTTPHRVALKARDSHAYNFSQLVPSPLKVAPSPRYEKKRMYIYMYMYIEKRYIKNNERQISLHISLILFQI